MSASKDTIKAAFLAALAPTLIPLEDVPGVFLRAVPYEDLRDRLMPLVQQDRDVTLEVLSESLCDEAGERLFDLADVADAAALAQLAGGPLLEVAKRAVEVNGLAAREADAKKG